VAELGIRNFGSAMPMLMMPLSRLTAPPPHPIVRNATAAAKASGAAHLRTCGMERLL
jgi:hypothetical protein